MSEYLEEKTAKFLRYWEQKRRNKGKFYWQYTLGWGIMASTIVYFLSIDFKLNQFEIIQYLLYLVFWSLGGLLWAHIQFRAQEKHYQKLIKKRES